jgi:hypothetical protein
VAIDDLPLPVVNLLNVIGVPWPYLNEDVLAEFATLTRDFGAAMEATHRDTTRAFEDLGEAHQAGTTAALVDGWTDLGKRHVYPMIDACDVLAGALHAAAAYVVGQKVAALGVLIEMAAAFVADQAAAIATAGIAEAAVPVILAGARAVVKSLAADMEQYIIANVVEAAAKPLQAEFEAAMTGLDWSRVAPAGPSGAIRLDASAARLQIGVLRAHAATMREHGDRYQAAVSALRF